MTCRALRAYGTLGNVKAGKLLVTRVTLFNAWAGSLSRHIVRLILRTVISVGGIVCARCGSIQMTVTASVIRLTTKHSGELSS